MQEASFSNFIRTVFYILMFYYLFKFLARLFLPMLVKKAVEKAGESFQKQQQYQLKPLLRVRCWCWSQEKW
jgi:hypothetical protein